MANRSANPLHAIQTELWPIAGNFTVDGSSNVGTVKPNSSSVLSVTKPAGTGIYRVTLADAWPDILYAEATLLVAAGTLNADIFPVTVTPSTGIVEFQCRQSSDGTALNPTSLTIMFFIVCKNSSVSP